MSTGIRLSWTAAWGEWNTVGQFKMQISGEKLKPKPQEESNLDVSPNKQGRAKESVIEATEWKVGKLLKS